MCNGKADFFLVCVINAETQKRKDIKIILCAFASPRLIKNTWLFFVVTVIFHELCTFERVDGTGCLRIHLAFELRQFVKAFALHLLG